MLQRPGSLIDLLDIEEMDRITAAIALRWRQAGEGSYPLLECYWDGGQRESVKCFFEQWKRTVDNTAVYLFIEEYDDHGHSEFCVRLALYEILDKSLELLVEFDGWKICDTSAESVLWFFADYELLDQSCLSLDGVWFREFEIRALGPGFVGYLQQFCR